MSASPKFRKDNAMAFLKRTSAKPVSLIHNLLNSGLQAGGGGGGGSNSRGGITNTTAANISGGGGGTVGGLGVGKAVLLRAPADSRPSIESMKRYLYEVVAAHAVSCLLNTNSSANDTAGNAPHHSSSGTGIGKQEGQSPSSSRPFPFARSSAGASGQQQQQPQQAAPEADWARVVVETARSLLQNQTISNLTMVANPPPPPTIHWIVCPGASTFDLQLMLASVQRNLVEQIASQLIPSHQQSPSHLGVSHHAAAAHGPLSDMDLPTLRQRVTTVVESVLRSCANDWNPIANNMKTNQKENLPPLPPSSTGLMPSAQEVLTALLVRALGFVEVSHPQDVGALIYTIATCHVSHLKRHSATSPSSSSSSSSPISPAVADQKASLSASVPPPTLFRVSGPAPTHNHNSRGVGSGAIRGATTAQSTLLLTTTTSTARFPFAAAGSTTNTTTHAAGSSSSASSNTPLVVLEGLGTRDSYLSSLERQVGVEVPLRWALESLSQSHHAAFIITESFVGGGNSGGGGYASSSASSPPSYPHDLRKDSFFVQNITSRWALTVPPLVASRLNSNSAAHLVSSTNEEATVAYSNSIIREADLAAGAGAGVGVKQEESAVATVKIEGSLTSSAQRSSTRNPTTGAAEDCAAGSTAAVSMKNNNNKSSATRNNNTVNAVVTAERDRMRRVSDQLAVMLTGHGVQTSLSGDEQCRSTSSSLASYFTNLCGFATASLQAVLTFTSTSVSSSSSSSTSAYDHGSSPNDAHNTTTAKLIRSVVTLSAVQRELVGGGGTGMSGGSYAYSASSSWSASGGGGGGAPSAPIVATPKLSIPFTFVSSSGSQGHDGKTFRWN